MNCPICVELYDGISRIPRTLAYGHTVCEICLKKCRGSSNFNCPLCKTFITIVGIENIPKNYALIEIIESTQPKGRQCQIHSQSTKWFCSDCKSGLCDECLENTVDIAFTNTKILVRY